MSRELRKRENGKIFGENTQYALALGVIGVMLFVIGIPAFVVVFLGAFSFFLWKLFGAGSASETRRIFEFYLAANEILRDDDRRWYGFELQDAILRGEKIIGSMPASPPLLHFAIGALYLKIGDHASAEKHLVPIISDGKFSEAAIVFPTNELREYVRVLRKIEREPAEAPQTSAAVRSLERLRKNKGKLLLEQSRSGLEMSGQSQRAELNGEQIQTFVSFREEPHEYDEDGHSGSSGRHQAARDGGDSQSSNRQSFDTGGRGSLPSRKPISEVLQDIYDDKVQ